MKNRKMHIIISMILLFLFISCGKDSKEENDSDEIKDDTISGNDSDEIKDDTILENDADAEKQDEKQDEELDEELDEEEEKIPENIVEFSAVRSEILGSADSTRVDSWEEMITLFPHIIYTGITEEMLDFDKNMVVAITIGLRSAMMCYHVIMKYVLYEESTLEFYYEERGNYCWSQNCLDSPSTPGTVVMIDKEIIKELYGDKDFELEFYYNNLVEKCVTAEEAEKYPDF